MALEDLNKTASDRSTKILFWALFISVLVHCLALVFYSLYKQVEQQHHRTEEKAFEEMLLAEAKKNPEAEKKIENSPDQSLSFMDTDPLLSQLPSKPTPYYGANNSRAANAEPVKVKSPNPTIRGTQTKIQQFVEQGTPMPVPQSAMPEPTPQSTAKKVTEEPFKPDQKTPEKALVKQIKPDEKYQDPPPPKNFGDTSRLMAKGATEPLSQPSANSKPQTERQRPRRLSDVRGVSNSKMASEGDAGDPGQRSSFDVQLTGFGAYDAQMIEAIRQSWQALIDTSKPGKNGIVVVRFYLHNDGSVSEIFVESNDSGISLLENLAVGGISSPAPFPKWTSAMMREIGAKQKYLKITFYYQ